MFSKLVASCENTHGKWDRRGKMFLKEIGCWQEGNKVSQRSKLWLK
jgi:hypothetical protein